MSLAACIEHQPMHQFGKGWVCCRCGVPINPKPLNFTIDPEWLKSKIESDDEGEIGAGFELFPLPSPFPERR